MDGEQGDENVNNNNNNNVSNNNVSDDNDDDEMTNTVSEKEDNLKSNLSTKCNTNDDDDDHHYNNNHTPTDDEDDDDDADARQKNKRRDDNHKQQRKQQQRLVLIRDFERDLTHVLKRLCSPGTDPTLPAPFHRNTQRPSFTKTWTLRGWDRHTESLAVLGLRTLLPRKSFTEARVTALDTTHLVEYLRRGGLCHAAGGIRFRKDFIVEHHDTAVVGEYDRICVGIITE